MCVDGDDVMWVNVFCVNRVICEISTASALGSFQIFRFVIWVRVLIELWNVIFGLIFICSLP